MAFKLPTLREARDFMIAVGQAVLPDRNFGNLRSYHARRATFLAAGMTQIHANVRSVADDVMPDTAGDGEPINRWGERILGIPRKGATAARKAAAGRVLGTPGTPVDEGEELLHEASGLRFRVAAGTLVGADEFVDVDIEAIDTGSATRLLRGQSLNFVVTPAGLQTAVVLQADLDEDGEDAEAFGAYRDRVLAAFSDPRAGGTQADYVAWLLELEGVATAYAYPNRAGLGTVDVVALHAGSGAARALDAADTAAALAHLRTKAPATLAGTGGGLRHLEVVPEATDVELVLEANGEASYAFDWTGGPLEVLAWTAGSRTLQFTADRPATVKAGHRIVLKGVASAQDGAELTIEALFGTDAVILEAAPAVAPAATDLAYSGGPLVTPVRDAIVAHMNGETIYAGRNRTPAPASALASTVGLEVLAYGIGPANPGGAYGTWIGDLLRAVIGQIAIYKGGVRNYQIAAPAADVQATDYAFPDDDQIGLIVPGAIIVRGAS